MRLMTRADLIDLTARGEGHHLEFKYRVPEPERFAKEVAALANADGGCVLIGVNDDGTLAGLKDVEEEEYAVKQALNNHLRPVVAIDLKRVRISRKRQVIAVNIPASEAKPHYVLDHANRRKTVFIRIKDKSVEASREARKLMHNPGSDQNILFTFEDKERILLRYLEDQGRVTVRRFAALARINRRHASRILLRLTRAKLLRHHPDLEEDYFTHGSALAQDAFASEKTR